jgi:hypothetical protein
MMRRLDPAAIDTATAVAALRGAVLSRTTQGAVPA